MNYNTIFSADSHYFHSNIINYQNRPFENAAQMNKRMIDGWNSVANEDTVAYFLGDFLLGGEGGERLVGSILSQLKFAHLHFISGNHDNHFHRWYKQTQPKNITLYGPYVEGKINNQRITLSHYPILSWNKKSKGSWMLHGHSHGNIKATSKNSKSIGKILDVGVDTNNFVPYTFEEISKIMANRPVVGELEEIIDHHIN